MTESYEDIMSRSWGDIPEVRLLPVGTWRLRARNATLLRPKTAEQSPVILVAYTPMEPLDDVDVDEIAELGDGYDWAANRLFARFWVEDAADWDKVRKHFTLLGIECPESESIQDTLKRVKGAEINAYVGIESYKNPQGEMEHRNNVSGFTVVD